MKAPLTDDAPPDPISPEDLADLIGGIERMPTRETEKNISHDRLLAMTLLLRSTGLRISDVVHMADMMISAGELARWSCASITGLTK